MVAIDNSTVSLTASPRIVEPGGELTVGWTVSGSHSSFDWIGLFGVGVPSTGYQDGFWEYVGNGLSGALMFRAPFQSGEYEFRYLLDDGYVRCRTSAGDRQVIRPTTRGRQAHRL